MIVLKVPWALDLTVGFTVAHESPRIFYETFNQSIRRVWKLLTIEWERFKFTSKCALRLRILFFCWRKPRIKKNGHHGLYQTDFLRPVQMTTSQSFKPTGTTQLWEIEDDLEHRTSTYQADFVPTGEMTAAQSCKSTGSTKLLGTDTDLASRFSTY